MSIRLRAILRDCDWDSFEELKQDFIDDYARACKRFRSFRGAGAVSLCELLAYIGLERVQQRRKL